MPTYPELKSILAFSLAVVSLPFAAGAQEAKPDRPAAAETSLKTHNIGLGAGFLTGYGLTYRHWFPTGNGYQLTFIPVARINDDETYFNSSVGAIGLRSFHRTLHSNFFGYYGGHYNYTYESQERLYFTNMGSETNILRDKDILHNVYAGAGLGIEVHFWSINYSLMFGYAANGRTRKFDNYESQYYQYPDNSDSGRWKNSFELQPSIESALFYSF